jgi:hypothetical protein
MMDPEDVVVNDPLDDVEATHARQAATREQAPAPSVRARLPPDRNSRHIPVAVMR